MSQPEPVATAATLPADYAAIVLRGILNGRAWRREYDRRDGRPVFLTHGRVKQYRDAIRACDKAVARAL